MAELVGDPLCEQRPSKTYSINYLASLELVIFAMIWEFQNLYISLLAAYTGQKDEKLSDENAFINPLSVYTN